MKKIEKLENEYSNLFHVYENEKISEDGLKTLRTLIANKLAEIEKIKQKITWEHVFNPYHKSWGNIGKAAEMAKTCGYEYFVWNDCVYTTKLEDMNILAMDL